MEQTLRQFVSGNLFEASGRLLNQLNIKHTQEEPTPSCGPNCVGEAGFGVLLSNYCSRGLPKVEVTSASLTVALGGGNYWSE